jgi:Concanavalin A-like lectin/glucanases superfamily
MSKAWWLSGLVGVMVLVMAGSASANMLPVGPWNLNEGPGTAGRPSFGMPGPASANVFPVGQWDFNEGSGTVARNDFSLSSGKGTLQGGVSWTAGRFQSGLSFGGVNGQVDVPDSPALEGSNVTVSAWVKANGSPGVDKYILAKGASGCCTGSYGLYTGANGGLEFYVATSPTTFVVSPDAGTGIWDGKWHNVVGTFDGSSVRVYVDGQQVGSGSPDNSPIQYNLPTASELVIGDYPWCSGLDFTGDIDEVKVFNRALSPAAISFGYQASNRLPSFFPFDLIF